MLRIHSTSLLLVAQLGWGGVLPALASEPDAETPPAVRISPEAESPEVEGSGEDQAEEKDFLDKISERITIRNSFDGTKNESKPATLLVTNDRGGDNFYSVDLGIKFAEWEPRSGLILFPAVEWHRRTEAEKEINKLSGGVRFEYQALPVRQFDCKGRRKPKQDPRERDISPFVVGGIDIIRDEEEDDTTLKGSLFLSGMSNKQGYPGADIRDGRDVFRGRYYPYLGVESFDPLSKDIDEALRVATARVYLELWPVATPTRGYFQFVVVYSYRQRIGGIEELGDTFDDLSVALNWYFDAKERFALGYEYKRGEDPSAAFAFREVSVLGFKLKL